MLRSRIREISQSVYLLKSKGDVVHAAILELLLKLVAGILKALASGLDVVYTDADVAKAFTGLLVSVGDLEVGVILGS